MRAIRRDGIWVNGKKTEVSFKACFDLKTLWAMLDMDCGVLTLENGKLFCPWCKVTNNVLDKSVWSGHTAHCNDFKCECSEDGNGCDANTKGAREAPDGKTHLPTCSHPCSLLKGVVELCDVVLCVLHCKMRITENLLKRLGEKAVERGTFDTWVSAVSAITHFWAVHDKGKVTVPMFMGNRVDKLLSDNTHLTSIVHAVYGPSDASRLKPAFNINKLTKDDKQDCENFIKVFTLWRKCKDTIWANNDSTSAATIKELRKNTVAMGDLYIEMFGAKRVFPYLHVLVCHAADMLERHGNLVRLCNEGTEHAHKLHRQAFMNATCKGGKVGRQKKRGGGGKRETSAREQVMLKFYRIWNATAPDVFDTSNGFPGTTNKMAKAHRAVIAAEERAQDLARRQRTRREAEEQNPGSHWTPVPIMTSARTRGPKNKSLWLAGLVRVEMYR
jgi:hypothetical protein